MSATYDEHGKLISGICVHGVSFIFREEKKETKLLQLTNTVR